MSEVTHKLIVVRRDGQTQETVFGGYHAESASDKLFNEAILDDRTIFATTVERGDGSRKFFAADGRAK